MENQKIKSKENSGMYFGKVTMTLKKGNQKYKTIVQHNKGTEEFFKYILNCIQGNNLYNYRPGYARLIYKVLKPDGKTYEEKVARYPINYTEIGDVITIPESDEDPTYPRASMIYHFFIPETLIEYNNDVIGVQLLSLDNSRTLYAEVRFDDPVTVNTNTNIDLQWEMSIRNYVEK